MCLFNFHMQNKYADEYNAKMNELKKEEREFFNKQREGKHAPLDISPSLCVCAFVCMCMFGFVSFLFFLFFFFSQLFATFTPVQTINSINYHLCVCR